MLDRKPMLAAAAAVVVLVALFPAAAVGAPSGAGARTAASPWTSAVTVKRPAVRAGDVLVGTVTARVGAAVAIGAPRGWTLVRRDTCTLPGTQMTQALYYRVATRSEPGAARWTLSRPERVAAAIAVYRGVQGRPVAHSGSARRDSRTGVAPSLRTTARQTLVVGSFGRSSATPVAAQSGRAARFAVSSGGAEPAAIRGVDFVRRAAGGTGPIATTGAAPSGCAIGQAVAFAPKGARGGSRPPAPTPPAPTPPRPTPPPPASGPGTTLTFTNTYWRCTQPIRSYATNGLPLRVVMNYTTSFVPPRGAGAVQLGAGCVGDGTNATDLVLDIRGDGRTYGPGDDAIRIMNARPGASNLQIEGRANCGPRVGSAHADGVQVLGGTNITFRNFEIGNYDAGLSTCQGAGGAFFYSMSSTNIRVEGGKYIACNHSLFAGNPGGHVSGAKFRSGRTDGTDPVCTGYAASNPCMGPVFGHGVTVSGITCEFWNRNARRWGPR